MTDPLDVLLVDAQDVDRELLASVLGRWLRISSETGEIIPRKGWSALDARRRALLFLLARKTAVLKKVAAGPEGAGAKVVEAGTGVKGGTMRRVLRELLDERLVAQDERRGYYVPSYALEDVAALLTETS